jgi:uncharacterized protein YjiS (DUF1127 family)
MSAQSAAGPCSAAARPGYGITIIRKVLLIVVDWRVRSRKRCTLSELDDHTLRDIGLTRAEYRFILLSPAAEPEPRGRRA